MYDKEMNKLFLDDLSDEVKRIFIGKIQYDKINKVLYLNRYNKTLKISNVKSLYYYDDDFYIISDKYMVIIWIDIITWNVIKLEGDNKNNV